MNSKTALEKTVRKFTNLIDGKVNPKYSVNEIIEYYAGCLIDNLTSVKDVSNIEKRFIEAEYDQHIEEQESLLCESCLCRDCQCDIDFTHQN
jgi:hypothetical protein